MQLWVLLWLSALCGAVLLALTALELSFEGRALGEASGHWACAFGVEFCGVVLSGVCAKQRAPRLDVRIFGRNVALLGRTKRSREAPKDDTAPASTRWKRLRRAFPNVGFVEVFEFLWAEKARVEVGTIDAEVAYGFEDISLTGKLAGLLYALSGVLPPQVRLVQHVKWDGGERWEVSAAGRISMWLGSVLFDAIWFMLRARFHRSKPNAATESAPSSSAGKHGNE